ncbi:hypothetical protein [Mesotoga sp.]|uniref:hypothetical protein n=1 Tax=Mesotoga sp. TaxID=2053577 RepID=UPI00345E8C98
MKLLHIVLNNGAHESVGGQPSAGQKIDLTSIAGSVDTRLSVSLQIAKKHGYPPLRSF